MGRFIGGFITKSPTTPSTSAASGVWTLDQAMQYRKANKWPGGIVGPILTISPAVSGKTSWDVGTTPLTLNAGTTYTITNSGASNVSFAVRMWGAGGGITNGTTLGGEGGYTSGTYTLAAGTSVNMLAGSAGTAGGGGGGATAIYNTSNANTVYAVAAGGGGAGNTVGGKGGAATGETSPQVSGWQAYGGQGGTQSSGGAGGYGDRGSGGAGSFRNGGAGSGNSTTYAGGAGWGVGGNGRFKSGDGNQGGGGGGYYGGGGGGASAGGAGGGGGSSYLGTLGSTIIAAQLTQGVGSDANRGTAGNAGVDGKIYISTI